jgi:hypothetical protein
MDVEGEMKERWTLKERHVEGGMLSPTSRHLHTSHIHIHIHIM